MVFLYLHDFSVLSWKYGVMLAIMIVLSYNIWCSISMLCSIVIMLTAWHVLVWYHDGILLFIGWHITNSTNFIQKIQKIRLRLTDLLVNFDVESLFTQVPIKDTLNMCHTCDILNKGLTWNFLWSHSANKAENKI